MKVVPPRIRIEQAPNEFARVFHTSTILSLITTAMFDIPFTPKEKDLLICLGPFGSALVSELEGVDGIVQIGIKRYELMVSIGPSFSWDTLEVEEKVIKALKEICFSSEKEVVEITRD